MTLSNDSELNHIRYISPYDKKSHEKKKRCHSVTEAKKTLRDWQRQIEDMTIDDSRTNTVEKFMTNWLVTYKQPSKPFLISAARVQIRVLLIPLKARMYDIIFVPSRFFRQNKKSYEVILYSKILMNMVCYYKNRFICRNQQH